MESKNSSQFNFMYPNQTSNGSNSNPDSSNFIMRPNTITNFNVKSKRKHPSRKMPKLVMLLLLQLVYLSCISIPFDCSLLHKDIFRQSGWPISNQRQSIDSRHRSFARSLEYEATSGTVEQTQTELDEPRSEDQEISEASSEDSSQKNGVPTDNNNNYGDKSNVIACEQRRLECLDKPLPVRRARRHDIDFETENEMLAPASSSNEVVCGSDGHYYESRCELVHRSCVLAASQPEDSLQVMLVEAEDKRHCVGDKSSADTNTNPRRDSTKSNHNKNHNHHPDHKHHHHLRRLKEPQVQLRSSNHHQDHGHHSQRIIRLKQQCNLYQYERMKASLLGEFHNDIVAMFDYFDSNSNQLIEAHELWPRRNNSKADEQDSIATMMLLSDDCNISRQDDDAINTVASPYRAKSSLLNNKNNSSSCWYQLDFAFEPRYPPNPCSLSHMVVFELSHLGYSFDKPTFERSFRQFAFLEHQGHDISDQIQQTGLRRVQTSTILALGDSRELLCYHENDRDYQECSWSRYHVDFSKIRDPHLSLMKQNSRLFVKDAQLYLSGHFACNCYSSEKLLIYQHTIMLHVLAEPQVQIRPPYVWSLPKSKVSFDCQYDYIDTNPSPEDQLRLISDQSKVHTTTKGLGCVEGDAQFGIKLTWKLHPLSSQLKNNNNNHICSGQARADGLEQRLSVSMAASRLGVDSAEADDSGQVECRVRVPKIAGARGSRRAVLRVGSAPVEGARTKAPVPDAKRREQHLWMFHDSGVTVYRLRNSEQQQGEQLDVDIDDLVDGDMQVVKQINGHSLISSQVDGNYNQLTLCGGLNPNQMVICEWSDNAVLINDVDDEEGEHEDYETDGKSGDNAGPRNSEQSSVPSYNHKSRSYVYVGQPNLNRIVVIDNSDNLEVVAIINTEPQPRKLHLHKPSRVRLSKWMRHQLHLRASSSSKQIVTLKHSVNDTEFSIARHLSQYDLWLLCYGQPLVVDASGDLAESRVLPSSVGGGPPRLRAPPTAPFAPIIPQGLWSSAGDPSISGESKESRLRNRKSVHIIQSTFLRHRRQQQQQQPEVRQTRDKRRASPIANAISEFRQATVFTSHHVAPGSPRQPVQDLVQDLVVPEEVATVGVKRHFAYVSHYNERRLFRVSMDSYRYDREVDLHDSCDPVHVTVAAQGLVVVHCRAPISHELSGQLVLDELTGAKIEFNLNVKAQEAQLSPDHRYLISIYTSHNQPSSGGLGLPVKYSQNQNQNSTASHQTIIFVQTVSVSGLKLEYEIKSSLDISSQLLFVWRNGYYCAVFASNNQKDAQTEILSLRLADGRLELMARVAGMSGARGRHRSQLVATARSRLAALSTFAGVHVIDLDDNRVAQSLRRHQAPPTLLWA